MYNYLNSLFKNYTYQQETFFWKPGYTFHTASTVSLKLSTPHVTYEKKNSPILILYPPPPSKITSFPTCNTLNDQSFKTIFTIFHSRALHGLSIKFCIKNFCGYRIQWHSGKVPLWFRSCSNGSQRRAFFINNCKARAAASSFEVCFRPLDAQYSLLHPSKPHPSVSWKK